MGRGANRRNRSQFERQHDMNPGVKMNPGNDPGLQEHLQRLAIEERQMIAQQQQRNHQFVMLGLQIVAQVAGNLVDPLADDARVSQAVTTGYKVADEILGRVGINFNHSDRNVAKEEQEKALARAAEEAAKDKEENYSSIIVSGE